MGRRPVHRPGQLPRLAKDRRFASLQDYHPPAGFEHDLQQVHDVGIVHALGYFRQQPIMPDIVEVAAQVDVDDARLVLNDRSRHPVHRFMS